MKKVLFILFGLLLLMGCSAAQPQESGPVELEIGNYVFAADYLHPVKDYYASDRSQALILVKEVEKGASKHDLERIVFDKAKSIYELGDGYFEEVSRSQNPTGQIDIPEGMSDLFEILVLKKGKEKVYCYFFLTHLEEYKDHLFIEIFKTGENKDEIFDFLQSVKIKEEV